MSFYHASFSVAGVNAANSILVNLKASTTDILKIHELSVHIETAPTTPPILQLERMNAVGTGAITSVAGTPANPAEGVASGVLEVAWATLRPTRLATPLGLRRVQLPVAVGSAWIWDFTNRPLFVPISGGVMLNLVTASGTTLGQFGGTITWDE